MRILIHSDFKLNKYKKLSHMLLCLLLCFPLWTQHTESFQLKKISFHIPNKDILRNPPGKAPYFSVGMKRRT
jgi:hypothetical protein